MRFLGAAGLALLVVACTAQYVSPDVQLASGEGVAVLNMVCDEEAVYVEVYTQGQYSQGLSGSIIRDAVIGCDEPTLKTVRLPEGDYFIGKLGARRAFADVAENDAIKFSVREKRLTYIGDFIFRAVSPPGRITYVNLSVEDRREEIRQDLEKSYSQLVERYDYVVSIAAK